MKEKIIAITNLEEKIEYSHMAGYKVITSKQEIKLLIDNESSCCEVWGWFWCNEDPQKYVGAELQDIKIVNEALSQEIMQKNNLNPKEEYFEGSVCYVNLETSKGTLQFVAYNQHNGYYGHTAMVISTQLNHEETL